MTSIFDQWGRFIAVTALHVTDNTVTDIKTPEKNGYRALQVGSGLFFLSIIIHDLSSFQSHLIFLSQIGAWNAKEKHVKKPQLFMFKAKGLQPKRRLKEFYVTEDAVLPVGTQIDVRHFVPGQFVDVRGRTIGKGFQGGMKRHGFRGLPASHGVSISHRSIGATGMEQDPGKVIKGKKMPGQMGGRFRVQYNLKVMLVFTEVLPLSPSLIHSLAVTRLMIERNSLYISFSISPCFTHRNKLYM